jgi:hypothetical protein
MRIREFLTEQQMSDVHDLLDVAKFSLPYTYRMNQIKNNDFYDLYRFGVAVADVRGQQANDNLLNKDINNYKPEFRASSTWGENAIVSGYDPKLGEVVRKAASAVNKSGQTMVSTPGSEEMKDTYTSSPIKAFKGYQ